KLVDWIGKALFFLYAELGNSLAQNPTATQVTTSMGQTLVLWTPYEPFDEPGAWWLKIPKQVWHDEWNYATVNAVLKAVPRTVAKETGGTGYNPPEDDVVYFPLYEPAVGQTPSDGDSWRAYLRQRKAKATFRAPTSLKPLTVDGGSPSGSSIAVLGRPCPSSGRGCGRRNGRDGRSAGGEACAGAAPARSGHPIRGRYSAVRQSPRLGATLGTALPARARRGLRRPVCGSRGADGRAKPRRIRRRRRGHSPRQARRRPGASDCGHARSAREAPRRTPGLLRGCDAHRRGIRRPRFRLAPLFPPRSELGACLPPASRRGRDR